MSTEKWESVTWDLIEREIVEQLLIANKRAKTSKSLTGLLAKPHAGGSVPRKDEVQPRRCANNG